MPVGIRTASEPYRSGHAASPIHLVMVAGIEVTAVCAELVIGHPEGSTPLAWVIVLIGGPALFLSAGWSFVASDGSTWSRWLS